MENREHQGGLYIELPQEPPIGVCDLRRNGRHGWQEELTVADGDPDRGRFQVPTANNNM